ncbi:MAG: EFR1 family ferrodoxin [Pelolinea sp.]|nr:EFR1 family ferrodoxin [Pelolinea sp.]
MDKSIISIFYFSGTGNTWWVSERLSEELNKLGFRASAYSIEQVTDKETAALIQKSSIIGLGFPIYGSDAPRIFHDFISRLPYLEKEKPIVGFVTQMAWSGDGMNFLEKELSEKGYRIRWASEFIMPNNIAVPIFPLPYVSDYNKFIPQLEKRRQQISDLCVKIANDEPYRQNSGRLAAASAWIQRGPFRLVHDWGRKFWSVDEGACNSCNICASLCPVGNIEMQHGLPVYSDQCVYCMRCFNYCSAYAIHYMGMKNTRLEKTRPFQGPTADFRPEMLIKK